MARIPVAEVERLMAARPDATLEAALGVFEVFASGSLIDEVYVLDDVSGKRIAIAPTALKDKFRRGGPMAVITISPEMGAGGPEIGMSLAKRLGYPPVVQELIQGPGPRDGPAEGKPAHLEETKTTPFERFAAAARHYTAALAQAP